VEYVIVAYTTERSVYVDGEENGPTNTVLRIDAGTHVFDLGEPVDYEPASREVAVEGTTVLEPMKVTFEQTEQA
jgi:hypothetical protein